MILENIKNLCKKSGISIKQLETNLNFGNGTIYKWDEVSPSVANIQKVAKYFNVSLDYLIK